MQRFRAGATWGRVFALAYDPVLRIAERGGLTEQRRALLCAARGRVLEVGAGTGLNVPHYPSGVEELILAEPDDAMRRRLVRRVGGRASVVAARAEQLPVADASVDTVVSTFVLCTVDDPQAALREIVRVMRPDGQLLLIEHVRAESARRAALQRLLRRPWAAFARGCRCDQPTQTLLRAAGFRVELRPASWGGLPPILAPVVAGRAFAAGQPARDGGTGMP